ncbi:hypothetical protein Tco_1159342, partial [Tanacetum coccineum]
MQQFWHTITYNLEAKTYLFTLDDQSFEVNAKLLRQALQITPKDSDHPFVQPPLKTKSFPSSNSLDTLDHSLKYQICRFRRDKRRRTLIRRQTGVVIGRKVHKESAGGSLDHSKKLKGVEILFDVVQYLLDMKIATKVSKNDYRIQPRTKGLDEGAGMTLEVLDGLSGSSSSSSSKSKDSKGFLPIDDEA